MSAIDSGVAAGPAKYAAGSPGSTRVNRNVTMTTPIRVGITVTRRREMLASMTPALFFRTGTARDISLEACHAFTIER